MTQLENQVVTVVGAVGGCGATTLAALYARRRARTGRVVLVDLDVGGPSPDVLLGLEGLPGPRWRDLGCTAGGLAAADLTGVLPRWCGVEVLAGADAHHPDPDGVGPVLDALLAGGATVVLDVGVRVLALRPALAEVAGAGPVVVAAGLDVSGVAAALAVPRVGVRPGAAVLRRRRGSTVPVVEAAHALGVPVLAAPRDGSVAGATDRGLGPRPGRRLGACVARLDRLLEAGTGPR